MGHQSPSTDSWYRFTVTAVFECLFRASQGNTDWKFGLWLILIHSNAQTLSCMQEKLAIKLMSDKEQEWFCSCRRVLLDREEMSPQTISSRIINWRENCKSKNCRLSGPFGETNAKFQRRCFPVPVMKNDWMKQSTWPRSVLCGGWCLCVALRTPSCACQKNEVESMSSFFEVYSSIFGFSDDTTLVSYVPKAVILMSTPAQHKNDKISTEDHRKPEIIKYYNATKSGVGHSGQVSPNLFVQACHSEVDGRLLSEYDRHRSIQCFGVVDHSQWAME